MEKHEIEHYLTDEIVCPYCGHEFEDSFGYNEGIVKCEECGKNFGFYKIVNVYYTSNKRPCANDEEPHNWHSLSFEYNGEVFSKNMYSCNCCGIKKSFENETRDYFQSFLEVK